MPYTADLSVPIQAPAPAEPVLYRLAPKLVRPCDAICGNGRRCREQALYGSPAGLRCTRHAKLIDASLRIRPRAEATRNERQQAVLDRIRGEAMARRLAMTEVLA